MTERKEGHPRWSARRGAAELVEFDRAHAKRAFTSD